MTTRARAWLQFKEPEIPMRTRSKIMMAALTAALVLAAGVGTANARRFETSSQGIRVVWPAEGRLTFTGFGGAIEVICAVTLEGTFHSRTISKVSGQLIGFITRANLTRPCGGSGEAYILNGVEVLPNRTVAPNSLPWHVRYDSFIGALPNIERIRVQLIGAAFLITGPLGAACLFRSTAARPAFGFIEREAGGQVSGLRADNTSQIPLQETLSGFCPGEGSFEGRGNVTVLGATTKITIRLVQ